MVRGYGWKRMIVATIACAAGIGATIPAMAAFHRNSDFAGTVIGNQLVDVATGYGKRMLSLRGDIFSATDMPRAAASVQAVSFPGKKSVPVSTLQASEPERQLPWRKLFGFVAASIGGLYAVTKAAGSISSPLLGRIIYLAFFCGIFFFAYTSHAQSLVITCSSVKEKVLDLLETADLRHSSEAGAEGGRRTRHPM